MDFGKKRQLLLFASRWPKYGELRDGKNFFNLFSPSAFGLVVPRESKNFVSFGQLSFGRVKNFCPSGVLTHPLRTKIFHSPSGQLASGNKILTLPWDNKACGLRRKKNEKSFCHPSVPPSFGISCQIKSTFFFSYVHTIFFQRWIEFFQLTRLLLYRNLVGT